MFVIAVNHLLDVVVFVVVALVSDVLLAVGPVLRGGNGADDWQDKPSLFPILTTPLSILETTPLAPSLLPMSPRRSRLLR